MPPTIPYPFSYQPPAGYSYQTLKPTTVDGGRVRVICFSRPDKYNALSPLAYKEWLWALSEAAVDPKVVATVVTGAGPFYSSGNELDAPTPEAYASILKIRAIVDNSKASGASVRLLEDPLPGVDAKQLDLIERGVITRELISTMIHFPKLLVAGVNGPAIGFATTTLALFDFVFATKQAWFQTPFMQWGFCAEGCSSITFPRIMGPAMANKMIYLGQKYTAEELLPTGFITELLPSETFQRDVIARATAMAKSLPPQAFAKTKALLKHDAAALDAANFREMNQLIERMSSAECEKRFMQFFAAKQKGKGGKKAKL
ncbi:hypothetical protein H9P43_004850 [Blastocladiella emersonii ATCC 22665]|nr:hypothetical protein H9P43_004850 [Blastocladiella emersonii ATCC 22665]